MMVSIDGFIEGPNGEHPWLIDEELHGYVNDVLRSMDGFLYGRRSYELMLGTWPTADTNPSSPEYEADFARIWKAMPKIVFSETIQHAEWNTRLIRENVAEEVAKLKAEPGKSYALLGGAEIASTLIHLGAVDEHRLFVSPVALGSGTPMFKDLDGELDLVLRDSHTFGSGVVHLHYVRADEGP